MASTVDFVSYATEQMGQAGVVSFKKMFGEYAIYCSQTLVALVCDNRLFVKPTQGVGSPTETPPYPGAKPSFLIENQIDDAPWLSELIRITARELTPAKKKTRGKTKGHSK
ncbi:TfoX N-terminal domain protein [Leptospira santarosai str. CBC1531]|uniref:TfoX/Sxy family protein n=1 Tax=Leptospira santarosai TaxID=28183 RepID=UPI0002BFBB11|nr:TfoX/Sxy family protein [Leptospira santarosai]EMP79750.1 TfoX N-terminal domain protein [Leptospira santarosai str. CBC1531]